MWPRWRLVGKLDVFGLDAVALAGGGEDVEGNGVRPKILADIETVEGDLLTLPSVVVDPVDRARAELVGTDVLLEGPLSGERDEKSQISAQKAKISTKKLDRACGGGILVIETKAGTRGIG